MMHFNAEQQFREAASRRGLELPNQLVHGRLSRCRGVGDKGKKQSGAYLYFADGVAAGKACAKRWSFTKAKILDGHNRYRACIEAGVEPRFRTFGDGASDGDDPRAFVISLNIMRRPLTQPDVSFESHHSANNS